MTDKQIIGKAFDVVSKQFSSDRCEVTMSDDRVVPITSEEAKPWIARFEIARNNRISKIDRMVDKLLSLRYELTDGGCIEETDLEWLDGLDE